MPTNRPLLRQGLRSMLPTIARLARPARTKSVSAGIHLHRRNSFTNQSKNANSTPIAQTPPVPSDILPCRRASLVQTAAEKAASSPTLRRCANSILALMRRVSSNMPRVRREGLLETRSGRLIRKRSTLARGNSLMMRWLRRSWLCQSLRLRGRTWVLKVRTRLDWSHRIVFGEVGRDADSPRCGSLMAQGSIERLAIWSRVS